MTDPVATIRAATSADLAAVADIFAHYVRHSVTTFAEVPPTAVYWRRHKAGITARSLPFLVAEVSNVVVGFAYAGPWRSRPAYRYTAEDTIYLAPDTTGQGIGSALLRTLLAELTEVGIRQVVAVVADTGSDASVALHRRFGFVEAGRLVGVGHKHGRWVDTILLQRTLATDQP